VDAALVEAAAVLAVARVSLVAGGGEPELGHDTAAALGTDVKDAMVENPCFNLVTESIAAGLRLHVDGFAD
jgi:hypothetical protein